MSKWDTGTKCNVTDDCSWGEEHEAVPIIISPEVWSVVTGLCEEVKLEWQMMLCGKETENAVIVDGYWIPKQEVSCASVKNLDIIDKEVIEERGIIATIHSHGNIGVSFSSTDKEFTNLSLIKNHIVVNNRGDIKATSRYDTPCGKEFFLDSVVRIQVGDTPEIVGRDNITERAFTPAKGVVTYGKRQYELGDTYYGNPHYEHAINKDNAKYYPHIGGGW